MPFSPLVPVALSWMKIPALLRCLSTLPGLTLSLGAVVFAFTAAHAEARHGDVVVVEVAEVIEHNLYVSGGNVTIHGRVKGDVIVTGNSVMLDGTVDGDVLVHGAARLSR